MIESLPQPITLSWLASLSERGMPTSWMQVARTGSFVSKRYGKFSISKLDLAQMLKNFHYVTPVPPTKLPIDYDHLSMNPQKPGDGIAAGWIVDLELRADGHELWAKVEWTSDGAKRVKAKEYQFVSPSFIRDYVYKTGAKIGTTLVAAAVTNHPFLEGMAALALSRGTADGERPTPDDAAHRGEFPSGTFAELVDRVKHEQQLDYRSAVRVASRKRPDLAADHERG